MKKQTLFFNGFLEGFKHVGKSVVNLINFILLLPVYYIVIGVISILAKMINKHFLELKKEKGSYWVDIETQKKNLEDYYRSF